MRFNILSLGLVATIFMSASVRAIPVGDASSEVGGALADATAGVDAVGGLAGSSHAYDLVNGAVGGIRKRNAHHFNSERARGAVDGRATSDADGSLADATGDAVAVANGGATDAVNDSAGELRKRGHHRRVGHGGRDGRFDTAGGIVQDAVQNAGDTVNNVLRNLITSGVRDTAGKRKRSVVGEPDEEEADEEEPEEEEVDENEEEAEEEEAKELGDAAPAGRR